LRERKATDRKKVMAMIYGIKNCRKKHLNSQHDLFANFNGKHFIDVIRKQKLVIKFAYLEKIAF